MIKSQQALTIMNLVHYFHKETKQKKMNNKKK